MAFTDYEMTSSLRWVQEHGEHPVAFSLEPIDPQKHEDAGPLAT